MLEDDFGLAVRARRLGHRALGSFSRHGEPPFHEEGIAWVVGWFNETSEPFAERVRDDLELSADVKARAVNTTPELSILCKSVL